MLGLKLIHLSKRGAGDDNVCTHRHGTTTSDINMHTQLSGIAVNILIEEQLVKFA